METTSVKLKKPRLVNVKKNSIENPETCHYWEEEIAVMKVGDIAKVSNGWERFWVIVKEINKTTIMGEVNNMLVCSPNLQCGDLILFKREHIYETWDLKEFREMYNSKNTSS
jgi:hypothetical protein